MHPVIGLIKERHRTGSIPGQRRDPYKLALAIEGGGMRSTVTGAIATAMWLLGLKSAFDVVYGSSAGASNGAYFISNQSIQAMRVYLDHISNRKFVDLMRPFRGKAIVDLYYGFNVAMGQLVPLDWQAVKSSPIELGVLATSVTLGQTVILREFTSQQDLLDALHASAHMPVVAGVKPFEYRGDLFWDASVLDTYCINAALAEGATHVLALRSRPKDRQRRKLSPFDRYVVAPYLRRYNHGLGDLLLKRMDSDFNGTAKLEYSEANLTSAPYLYSISPRAGASEIGRLETNRAKLFAGAMTGVEAILTAFEPHPSVSSQVREVFDQYKERS